MIFIETTSTVTNTDLYSIQRERNPELKKIYELNQSFGKWMIYLVYRPVYLVYRSVLIYLVYRPVYLVYRPVLPSLVNLHTVSCLATVRYSTVSEFSEAKRI